jgi:hypothetical protein
VPARTIGGHMSKSNIHTSIYIYIYVVIYMYVFMYVLCIDVYASMVDTPADSMCPFAASYTVIDDDMSTTC